MVNPEGGRDLFKQSQFGTEMLNLASRLVQKYGGKSELNITLFQNNYEGLAAAFGCLNLDRRPCGVSVATNGVGVDMKVTDLSRVTGLGLELENEEPRFTYPGVIVAAQSSCYDRSGEVVEGTNVDEITHLVKLSHPPRYDGGEGRERLTVYGDVVQTLINAVEAEYPGRSNLVFYSE